MKLKLRFLLLLDRLGIKKFKRSAQQRAFDKLIEPGLIKQFELAYRTDWGFTAEDEMKIEPKEGRVEIIMKYKGVVYGSGLDLKDFPKREDLARGLRQISFSMMETLRMNYYFAKTLMMDGCEHRVGDPNCCGSHGEICTEAALAFQSNLATECGGILHYQPVYGGYYYECDRCGRTK